MSDSIEWVVWVVAAVGLSLLAVSLTRRFAPERLLHEHLAVGAVFATFGVLYSVVLASTVVGVWDRHETAEMTVVDETNALFGLVRLAESFPTETARTLEGLAFAYGDAVVGVEWPAMAERQAPAAEAQQAIDALYRGYGAVDDPTIREDPAFAASLEALRQLDDARGDRIRASQHRLPDSMWWLLIVGAGLTVVFLSLLGTRVLLPQLIATGTLVALIAMMLVLIHDLDAPFQEPLGIESTGMARGLSVLSVEVGNPPSTP